MMSVPQLVYTNTTRLVGRMYLYESIVVLFEKLLLMHSIYYNEIKKVTDIIINHQDMMSNSLF